MPDSRQKSSSEDFTIVILKACFSKGNISQAKVQANALEVMKKVPISDQTQPAKDKRVVATRIASSLPDRKYAKGLHPTAAQTFFQSNELNSANTQQVRVGKRQLEDA